MGCSKSFALLVATLALGSVTVMAQYDEDCHYECISIYCDLFEDYCDYDCQEFCYPFRKSRGQKLDQVSKVGPVPVEGTKTGLNSLVTRQLSAHAHDRNSATQGRTGKVVRMRIHDQTSSRNQRARNSANNRGSPAPGRFALFQSCLSNSSARPVEAS